MSLQFRNRKNRHVAVWCLIFVGSSCRKFAPGVLRWHWYINGYCACWTSQQNILLFFSLCMSPFAKCATYVQIPVGISQIPPLLYLHFKNTLRDRTAGSSWGFHVWAVISITHSSHNMNRRTCMCFLKIISPIYLLQTNSFFEITVLILKRTTHKWVADFAYGIHLFGASVYVLCVL